MKALGSNSSINNYNWLDLNPAEGNNFYRLKVIDQSGKSKYSSIVKVNINRKLSGISVFPNPVIGNQLSIELKNKSAGKYYLKLFNLTGQILLNAIISHNGGSATETINLPTSLNAGAYHVQLIDETGNQELIKIIKK